MFQLKFLEECGIDVDHPFDAHKNEQFYKSFLEVLFGYFAYNFFSVALWFQLKGKQRRST